MNIDHILFYSCGDCQACKDTERELLAYHLSYKTIDINDPKKLDDMRRRMGSGVHPGIIVVHGQADHMFNGYKPDLLAKLADHSFFDN